MTAHLPVRRIPTPGGPRDLPEEVPVALVYNGTTQAVMMATPADIADFALGFTLTEGIATATDAGEIEIVTHDLGIEARLWLPAGREAALAARRRALVGAVGCGLCGIDSLEAATRALPRLPPGGPVLTRSEAQAALDALRAHQPLHDATHAVHAAGLWRGGSHPSLWPAPAPGDAGHLAPSRIGRPGIASADMGPQTIPSASTPGDIEQHPAPGIAPARADVASFAPAPPSPVAGGIAPARADVASASTATGAPGMILAREDVGRHNALDKLVGAAARAGVDPGGCAVVLTSRLSVEMVQKTVMAGARLLLSVSAPTAHAVRLAEASGLTLVSTAGGLTIYTHPERILP